MHEQVEWDGMSWEDFHMSDTREELDELKAKWWTPKKERAGEAEGKGKAEGEGKAGDDDVMKEKEKQRAQKMADMAKLAYDMMKTFVNTEDFFVPPDEVKVR